jgi:hypothetical protein
MTGRRGNRTVMSSRFGSAFRPSISPDGRWLTYGSRWESETGLVLRELDTGDERWLAYPVQRDEQESIANMDVLPGYAFTPDSREVVMSYGGKIWRVPVDGSDPVEVPFTVHAEVPVGPEVAFDYPSRTPPRSRRARSGIRLPPRTGAGWRSPPSTASTWWIFPTGRPAG